MCTVAHRYSAFARGRCAEDPSDEGTLHVRYMQDLGYTDLGYKPVISVVESHVVDRGSHVVDGASRI